MYKIFVILFRFLMLRKDSAKTCEGLYSRNPCRLPALLSFRNGIGFAAEFLNQGLASLNY